MTIYYINFRYLKIYYFYLSPGLFCVFWGGMVLVPLEPCLIYLEYIYQVMQMYFMNRRLKDTNVIVSSLHPGVVRTDVSRSFQDMTWMMRGFQIIKSKPFILQIISFSISNTIKIWHALSLKSHPIWQFRKKKTFHLESISISK